MDTSRPRASLQCLATRLAECAHDVDREDVIPADQLSALLCQIGALQTIVATRLVRALQTNRESASGDRDRLLPVAETLGVDSRTAVIRCVR